MRSSAQIDTVRRVVTTQMPTRCGVFQVIGFERDTSKGSRSVETALAMVMGDPGDLTAEAPLLRVHSQCLTSEAFGSLRCDCGEQLETAMRAISDDGTRAGDL